MGKRKTKSKTKSQSGNNFVGQNDTLPCPKEIVSHIFSFLDHKSLAKASATCKKNQVIANFIKEKRMQLVALLKEHKLEEAIKFIKTENLNTNFHFYKEDSVETTLLHLLPPFFKPSFDKEQATKLFNLIMTNHADLNFPSGSHTPLILAILNESKDLFDLFISSGADINASADDLNTPIMYAAQQSNSAYFLSVLLNKENIKIAPVFVINDTSSKMMNLTWRLLYLKMIIKYLTQLTFDANSQKGIRAQKCLELAKHMYSETRELYLAKGINYFNIQEYVPFANAYSNLVSDILHLTEEDEDDYTDESDSEDDLKLNNNTSNRKGK